MQVLTLSASTPVKSKDNVTEQGWLMDDVKGDIIYK